MGAQLITLDVRRHALRVTGPAPAAQAVRAFVAATAAELKRANAGAATAAAAGGGGGGGGGGAGGDGVARDGDDECGICLCELTGSHTRLACSHAHCRQCLRQQVESALHSRELPLACATCQEPLALRDALDIVPPSKLGGAVQA